MKIKTDWETKLYELLYWLLGWYKQLLHDCGKKWWYIFLSLAEIWERYYSVSDTSYSEIFFPSSLCHWQNNIFLTDFMTVA